MSQLHETPQLLAVDDNMENLTLLQHIFERKYRVTAVNSGQDALDILEKQSFDIVLLDIMMPVMDGLQTLQNIRKNPQTGDLPVILVSARADREDVIKGLKLGANDYVTKPIKVDVLMARVETQVALKRLQDERKNTIRQLESAHEMKDRFFHIVSHDLKGPIMNLTLAHSLLEKMAGETPGVMDVLSSMESTLKGMEGVLKEFLDAAALQTGKIDLNVQAVPVDDILFDVTEQHKLHAQRKEITLRIIKQPTTVQADAERTKQVLGNLVSNAIKYSPTQSTVTLWTTNHDSKVRICVSDQGPGIPAHDRDRLFTQFGRLTPRPTAGESSTGLGLWIVKHLVTLQNGLVGADWPPEGGSVFWVELPAAPENGQAKAGTGALREV
ncbi:MAG: response regulator [Burkholderiales bacterium]|nr:response regulator [Anaerolineae bacterium]